jgi:hypothetical protein
MLKKAGVSNALAMAIIGHESEAVSRQYTHYSSDDLRAAMAKLPDVSASRVAKNRSSALVSDMNVRILSSRFR